MHVGGHNLAFLFTEPLIKLLQLSIKSNCIKITLSTQEVRIRTCIRVNGSCTWVVFDAPLQKPDPKGCSWHTQNQHFMQIFFLSVLVFAPFPIVCVSFLLFSSSGKLPEARWKSFINDSFWSTQSSWEPQNSQLAISLQGTSFNNKSNEIVTFWLYFQSNSFLINCNSNRDFWGEKK